MTNHYSSTAQQTALDGAVNDAATSITVDATTGFPASTPYILALDHGTADEELVKVTGVAGTTLTVVRGHDSTTATDHADNAVVKHVHCAEDFRLSREHEDAEAGVHGVTGDVVGTTDVQVVTNKDLTSGTNTFPTSLARTSALSAQVATEAAHEAATAAHGATGAVVGTTNVQTMTNKTLTSPTINTPTITSPTVTDLTLDGEDVSGAWTAFVPTATELNIGDGTREGYYKQIGKTVHFVITVVLGSTSTITGTLVFTPPVPAVSRTYPVYLVGSVWCNLPGGSYPGAVIYNDALPPDGGLVPETAAGGSVNATSPGVWTQFDQLYICGTYEAA